MTEIYLHCASGTTDYMQNAPVGQFERCVVCKHGRVVCAQERAALTQQSERLRELQLQLGQVEQSLVERQADAAAQRAASKAELSRLAQLAQARERELAGTGNLACARLPIHLQLCTPICVSLCGLYCIIRSSGRGGSRDEPLCRDCAIAAGSAKRSGEGRAGA